MTRPDLLTTCNWPDPALLVNGLAPTRPNPPVDHPIRVSFREINLVEMKDKMTNKLRKNEQHQTQYMRQDFNVENQIKKP